jgi:activator of HSP90 ATPase
MRSVIRQSVVLPAAPDELFAMYLDPLAHAAFTGSPVTIGAEAGSAFAAFGGALSGTMLEVIRPQLIVQSWRSTNFATDDPDSTLVLLFGPGAGGGRIDLVHVDVPEQDYQGVTQGWEQFYWTPWRRYLERRSPRG